MSVAPQEYLTEYEVKFARQMGATEDELNAMGIDKRILRFNESEQDNSDENHPDTCDCKDCESMLFEGAVDEDNDGGESMRNEWRARIAEARIVKAKSLLLKSERMVRDWIKRTRDYEAEMARKKAELEAAKAAYVHVEGTSKLLQYGLVPDSLHSKIQRSVNLRKYVRHVDTIRREDGSIHCRFHVLWPLQELNEMQREAHFRLLLDQENLCFTTSSDVSLVEFYDDNSAANDTSSKRKMESKNDEQDAKRSRS